ncbi:MAG: hypothetical protein K6C35_02920 [Eubacterium sp.]|nr:hypothetical protein [Eubacterium sp.]
MKRKIKILLFCVSLTALTACGNKDIKNVVVSDKTEQITNTSEAISGTDSSTAELTETTTEKSTAEGTDSSTEKTTESTTEGKKPGEIISSENDGNVDIDEIDIKNPEGMLKFLDGDWIMLPYGYPSKEVHTPKLSFDAGKASCRYTNGIETQYFDATLSFKSLFDDEDIANHLTLVPADASDKVVSDKKQLMDGESYFQILAAVVGDKKVLALRTAGNGYSIFQGECLDPEMTTSDGFWIFEQENAKVKAISEETDKFLRQRNDSFYAFIWKSPAGECYVQKMNTDEFIDSWYDEDMLVLFYSYENSGYGNYTVKYKVKGDGMDGYDPGLVYITTDVKGNIINCERAEYLGYGYYKPVPGEDRRKNLKKTDEIFLGDWINDSDQELRLSILEDDPQVGGYKIEVFKEGEPYIFGQANVDGNDLYINQGFFKDDYMLIGHFSSEGEMIIFTIDESENAEIKEGESFRFTRVVEEKESD